MSDAVREAARGTVTAYDKWVTDPRGANDGALALSIGALRAALALDRPEKEGGDEVARIEEVAKERDAALDVLRELRALVRSNVDICRNAAETRTGELARREENAPILEMLREQKYAWEQKASSYDALGQVIDEWTKKRGLDATLASPTTGNAGAAP